MEFEIDVFKMYMVGKLVIDPICSDLQNYKLVDDEYEEWLECFDNMVFGE